MINIQGLINSWAIKKNFHIQPKGASGSEDDSVLQLKELNTTLMEKYQDSANLNIQLKEALANAHRKIKSGMWFQMIGSLVLVVGQN